jgi:ATP/maltotriose-dependent transcriptional regulator MalT
MTYAAEHFLNSPAFLEIATQDAVTLVAKTNGQAYALTLQALAQQVPNVVRQVAKLITGAAEYCAQEANAGRLWK